MVGRDVRRRWLDEHRLNPLTSADLVSYAAGLANMPVRHVALGTLFGMLPHCYLQAYLAQRLFETLPSAAWLVAGACLVTAFAATAVWRVIRRDVQPEEVRDG
jgi:uncharacterized membrane protein YdjX (TVP38/TMEM64 family)